MSEHHLRNNPYKVAIAAMVGTAIEFYDYYIYAAAAVLVFNTQFFDKSDPQVATILSLSTLALAFFARPIGSALFGHFGDKIGRKKTLVASLLTIGRSTVGIGLLPAPEGKRAWFGTFPQLGAPIGLLMANGVFFAISSAIGHEQMVAWGWRIPFIASLVLVFVGLWMRLSMHESHVYREAEAEGKTKAAPVREVFVHHWKPILQAPSSWWQPMCCFTL